MNLKKTIILLCVLISYTAFSGIIRHDVDEVMYLELASQKQFDCVGQIYKDASASGSCVLISERFVLSVAHVFIDSDIRQDTILIDGHTIIAFVPYNQRLTDITKLSFIFNGEKVKAKNLILHPNYLDSLPSGSCDIALIELERPLTTVLPAILNTKFDELTSKVVGVGFGASGVADKPETVAHFKKKIAGENVVDSIAEEKYLGVETVLFCDFDHPTIDDCNKIGSSLPMPLEYICSGGDSGGGLFRQKDDTWELIGICSGVMTDIDQLFRTGYYGQIMEWTRVSAFTKWIAEHIK